MAAKLYALLKELTSSYPLQCFLVMLIFGLIFGIYMLLKIKIDKTNYKINNFFWTYVGASIYIFFYIGLFFSLRVLNVQQSSNLKILQNFFSNCFASLTSTFSIILLLLVIVVYIFLWLLIFVKLQVLCKKQLMKLHIYRGESTVTLPYRNIYTKICKKFHYTYSFRQFAHRITCFFNFTVYFKLKLNNYPTISHYYNQYLIKHMTFLLRVMPLVILIILFLYECYYNDFTLKITVYYLLFYMVYTHWYRLSMFLEHNQWYLNAILFEQYYGSDVIKYVNVTEEENAHLLDYLKNGLYENRPFSFIIEENEFIPRMIINKRFFQIAEYLIDPSVTDRKKMVYFNYRTQDYFEPKELLVINGKLFVEYPEEKDNEALNAERKKGKI